MPPAVASELRDLLGHDGRWFEAMQRRALLLDFRTKAGDEKGFEWVVGLDGGERLKTLLDWRIELRSKLNVGVGWDERWSWQARMGDGVTAWRVTEHWRA